jgi:hypothetical protein
MVGLQRRLSNLDRNMMNRKSGIETNIPFTGFYETSWDDEITEAVESCGWDVPQLGIPARCLFHFSQAYTDAYAELLRAEAGWKIPLHYTGVTMPAEYNYETNMILARIYIKDVRALRKNYEPEFRSLARKALQPRPGFIPFYDQDPSTWGPIRDWKSAQAGLVLSAVVDRYAVTWEDFSTQFEAAVEKGVQETNEEIKRNHGTPRPASP